jgi:hypothetical protein
VSGRSDLGQEFNNLARRFCLGGNAERLTRGSNLDQDLINARLDITRRDLTCRNWVNDPGADPTQIINNKFAF